MKKYLSVGVIIIIIIAIIIGLKNRGVKNVPAPTVSPSASASTTPVSTDGASPLNISYKVDEDIVTLKNGKASEPVARGEITTEVFGTPATGDVGNEKGVSAMYLVQETSGTGIFFYVVAAYKVNGAYKGTEAVFLGDRIAPQTIRIANGKIEVNYADRKQNEPMSAEPTVGVTKKFTIKGGELVETN